MDPAEIQNLLNQGIRAVKNGELAVAREHLMQVVQADERNEPAWLWLGAALDQPADQLWALENVLVINPAHPEALAKARDLRVKLRPEPTSPPHVQAGLVSPVGPTAALASENRQVELTAGSEASTLDFHPANENAPADIHNELPSLEDDPFQCPYCGRPTEPDDNRCRHCGHGLLIAGPWHAGGYLFIGLTLMGLQLQAAILQALIAYLRDGYPQFLQLIPVAAQLTNNLLLPAILRAVAWVVIVYMLLSDAKAGYGAAAGVAVADLVWAGTGYRLGYLSPLLAGVNATLAAIIGTMALAAVVSQAQSRLRLRVVPDRKLDGAHMFHRRALVYVREGKWALAALHWRQAITRAPREALYYKELGRAQVRLGRYAQAVRSFRSGAEAAPGDVEFVRLIESVRTMARNS